MRLAIFFIRTVREVDEFFKFIWREIIKPPFPIFSWKKDNLGEIKGFEKWPNWERDIFVHLVGGTTFTGDNVTKMDI